MSRSLKPLEIRLQPDGKWVVRTFGDHFFVVNDKCKEAIEIIAAMPDTEAAWSAYLQKCKKPIATQDEIFSLYKDLTKASDERNISAYDNILFRTSVLPGSMAVLISRIIRNIHHPWFVLLAVAGAAAYTATGPAFSWAVTTPILDAPTFLLVCLLIISSALAHEFGHASALYYEGQEPGGIYCGVKMYIFPCFFTDVSSAWLLERGGKIRVNFGGTYAQLLFAFAVLLASQWFDEPIHQILTEASKLISLLAIAQLIPFAGSDGAWVILDIFPPLSTAAKRTQLVLFSISWLGVVLFAVATWGAVSSLFIAF